MQQLSTSFVNWKSLTKDLPSLNSLEKGLDDMSKDWSTFTGLRKHELRTPLKFLEGSITFSIKFLDLSLHHTFTSEKQHPIYAVWANTNTDIHF